MTASYANLNSLQPGLRRVLLGLFVCCAALFDGDQALLAQQAAAPAEPPKNVVEPLPAMSPTWPAGYQVRYTLRVVGDPTKSTSKSVVARLPNGGWFKPDGSDIVVHAADGTEMPVAVLSHAPLGDTLIQFPRHDADAWYWASAVNASAPGAKGTPLPEGIVLEARNWAGGDYSSWAATREGLAKCEPLLHNAFVGDIIQKCNPARPELPRNYAVSYRGTLNIPKDGIYRFFVNSEDASFLFIDGLKVCDRPGPNERKVGTIPTKSIGSEVELKAGPHPVEVYHVLQENPYTYGGCMLLWVPPEAKAWTPVPYQNFVQPDLAHVAALEGAGNTPAVAFGYGIDDVLVTAGGASLHLVRFEAQGKLPDPAALKWDFGDGGQATGRSVWHVYFAAGDYQVSLAGGALPPFKSRVHVYAAPGAISPFSVERVLATLSTSDWKKCPPERLDQILDFLRSCDHPDRWPLQADVTRQQLQAEGLDAQTRAQIYRSHLEALGRLGRKDEIDAIRKKAMTEFAKLPTARVGVQLTVAGIYDTYLKNTDEAARMYEELLREHRRLEHPDVRMAAIRWGDLAAETNDMKRAAELYKLAATLGGEAFQTSAAADAVTRGALLRVAEQKLKTGDINETRMLLDKIEVQYPEQKLEGLYRLLRAESDRFAGRYEEALRNYEVLLQLRQWAGYHDRTMFGIADCYAKMDDIPKAVDWFKRLERTFPKYYEQQKLADRVKVVSERLTRAEAKPGALSATPVAPRKFSRFVTGFEPTESQFFGTATNFPIVRGLGLDGPHVALLDSYPVYKGYLTYERPLTDLTPGGRYWMEIWYRETLFSQMPGFSPHVYLYLYDGGKLVHPTRGQMTTHLERSSSGWRKMGFVFEALAHEGRVVCSALNMGVLELDALTVRPVSDRQLDALSNFIDAKPEGE